MLIILPFSLLGCGDDDSNPGPTNFQLDIASPMAFIPYEVPENNPLTTEGIFLGRMLFYEKSLSIDNSVSCSSCHQQQLGFSDNKAFSDGINGQMTDRHAMPIVNPVFDHSFFWDGRAASLEEQALGPIQNAAEMGLTLDEAVTRLQQNETYPPLFESAFGSSQVTSENIGKAIAQFERTLISDNSKYDQFLRGEYTLTNQEELGKNLFYTHPNGSTLRGGNCGDCHSGVLQTDFLFHNNGLDTTITDIGRMDITGNNSDLGAFKTPSLRNVSLSAPYMHDGRFQTLEEVLDHYNDHVNIFRSDIDPLMQATSNTSGPTLALTNEEKLAIIAFLELLTDENFLTNEAFSDPHDK